MNWNTYIELFDNILNKDFTEAPYDKEDYFNYVELNEKRQSRWLKKGEITAELKSVIESIDQEQKWVLITEPWCGDASHINPFIFLMSELSDKITLEIQLRDSEESEIDNYLTNGGKAIPKLVVRDDQGEDLFTWGPRPKAAQDLVLEMKTDDSKTADEKKMGLQKWYNKNKGLDIQKEFIQLLG